MSVCVINGPDFSRNTWKGTPSSDGVINKLCAFIVSILDAPHRELESVIWDQLLRQAQILMRDFAMGSIAAIAFYTTRGCWLAPRRLAKVLGHVEGAVSCVQIEFLHVVDSQ